MDTDQRVRQLRRAGFSLHTVAAILGVDANEIAEFAADPADVPPAGGGGAGGSGLPSYAELIEAHGAGHYWPLASDAVDVIAGLNGTLNGGLSFGSPGPFGAEDGCCINDGSGWIALDAVASALTGKTNDVTVEGWVWLNANRAGYLISPGTIASDGADMLVGDTQHASGGAGDHLKTVVPGTNYQTHGDVRFAPPAAGRWYHAAFTLGINDGSRVGLWLDGIGRVVTASGQPTAFGNGGRLWNTGPASRLAHVAWYPRRLSDAELMSHAMHPGLVAQAA